MLLSGLRRPLTMIKSIPRFLQRGNMFKGISLESEPIETFRERVRRMSEEELIRQGKLVRGLCNDPKPLDVWVQKLKVLREEYRRRHPKIA